MFDIPTLGLIVVAFYLISSIKILREYERGVIFRLGRVLPQPKGPGLILVFAPIDRIVRLSLRLETIEVPAQDVVTRDNVTVGVESRCLPEDQGQVLDLQLGAVRRIDAQGRQREIRVPCRLAGDPNSTQGGLETDADQSA